MRVSERAELLQWHIFFSKQLRQVCLDLLKMSALSFLRKYLRSCSWSWEISHIWALTDDIASQSKVNREMPVWSKMQTVKKKRANDQEQQTQWHTSQWLQHAAVSEHNSEAVQADSQRSEPLSDLQISIITDTSDLQSTSLQTQQLTNTSVSDFCSLRYTQSQQSDSHTILTESQSGLHCNIDCLADTASLCRQ